MLVRLGGLIELRGVDMTLVFSMHSCADWMAKVVGNAKWWYHGSAGAIASVVGASFEQ
jgi:hypothetical protein